jgi:hypothetical protein
MLRMEKVFKREDRLHRWKSCAELFEEEPQNMSLQNRKHALWSLLTQF